MRKTTGSHIRALLLGACATAALKAWVPIGGDLWPDGPIPISFDLVRTAPAGSTGDWDAALLEAMALWNARLQRVQLVRAPLEGEAWYHNGRSEVFFDRNEYDDPFPSGVLAVSFASRDRGVLLENDIIFNRNRAWAVFRGALGNGPADLRRVAVHELGHLLGLDHPDEAGQSVSAIMNSRVSATETPTADDETGARALYDFGPGAAPVIVVQPVAVSTVQGAAVRLSVFAGGRGPLAYEWQFDGAAVAGGTRATLNLTARLADQGSYAVVIRNGGGAVTSNSVRLAVRAAVPPQVMVGASGPDLSQVGTNVTVTASAIAGDRPMSFVWRKDGAIIAGATLEQLSLKDVQFSDSGDYSATVTNVAGSATGSAQVRVVPGEPPAARAVPSVRAIAPGRFVRLDAPVDFAFSGTIQWQRDGVALPGGTSRTYDIAAFQSSDVGRYSVVLGNPFGRVTVEMGELLWYDRIPLTITRQPAAATVYPGATVSFDVESDAVAPRYQWLRQGVALAGQTQRILILPNVGLGDSAAYAVEVRDGTNRVMSAGADLQIMTIPQNPLITSHPEGHSVTPGTRVDLTVAAVSNVQPPEAQGLSYQWFKEGQPVEGATNHFLSVTATTVTAGRYHVQVVAPSGTTRSENAEIEIVAAPRLIPQHPGSRYLLPGSETLRLEGFAAEIMLRRNRALYSECYFSKGGVALPGTPFALGAATPGIYTLTIRNGAVTETSRPFTIAFYNPGLPMLSRHPAGGAYDLGAPVTLSVASLGNDVTFYDWRGAGIDLSDERNRAEFRIPAFAPHHVGDYFVYVRNALGQVASQTIRLEQRGVMPPIILQHPVSGSFALGEQVTLRAEAARSDARFQWYRDGRIDNDQTGPSMSFLFSADRAGAYSVIVTDSTGTATSRVAQVTARSLAVAPVIATQPASSSVVAGGEANFFAGASGTPLPTQYQWLKNGVAIAGATDPKLRLRGVQPDQAGTYTVVITNSGGSVVSQPATLAVDSRARLVNLATRAAVGRGADILIAGFVVRGAAPREMLVRGIGEQLGDFGVSGVLRDPVITLRDAKGTILATNDDWFRTGETNMEVLRAAARRVGAFALREDAHDGALVATLPPGSYTAQVTGLANTTGVGLVEIYELGAPSADRLINLSSRAMVGTGANILIPGLVLNGLAPRRLLFRAVGPGLAELGVAGVIADPVMKIFRGDDVVAQNDNWGDQPGAAQLAPAMAAVGAFPLRAGSRDAALLLDLTPGSYTVQVSGVGDATGVALVEVYEAAP